MQRLLYTLAQFVPGDFDIPKVADPGKATIKLALQVVFSIAAAAALIMITVGGFKYTISRGDPNSIKSAKDTIVYSIVGLVVAIFSLAIVTFVLAHV